MTMSRHIFPSMAGPLPLFHSINVPSWEAPDGEAHGEFVLAETSWKQRLYCFCCPSNINYLCEEQIYPARQRSRVEQRANHLE